MSEQIVDMLEAVQRPQVARLQARVIEVEAENARHVEQVQQLRGVLEKTTRALYRAIRLFDGSVDHPIAANLFIRRSELATIHNEACAILASPDWPDLATVPSATENGSAEEGESSCG